jgi:outer membrane protein assembly factor BamB/calcineurin-like phosphoesterase family protein
MNKIFLLLVILGSSTLSFAQKGGFVYQDVNENGIFDKKEPHIPNVMVTDGFDIVKTDKKGMFTLPDNPKARFITITTPEGYKHTTSFYQSIGSDNHTFGLKKAGKRTGKFIHITDIHAGGHDNWIGNIKQYVKRNEVDFIALTGDFTRKYGMDRYSRLVNDKTMGTRVVFTIGNHDKVSGDFGEQYFEGKFGPTYYSFDIGETHFIVTPMLKGDARPSYTKTQILSWLRKDIEMQPEGKPLVIFNHENWLWDEECVVKTEEEIIDFKTYNLKAFIYGHNHHQFMSQYKNGIKIYCTSTLNMGGRNHCPSAYREFTFDIEDKNDIRAETKFSDLKNHLVSNVYRQKDKIKIVASVYHAFGKVKELIVSSGGEKVLMTQNTNFVWETEIPFTNKDILVSATFSDGNRITHHTEIEPYLEWVSNIGANTYFTAPIIQDGVIYTASIDDDLNESCGIHAIDAKTGEKLWYFHTKNSVINDIVNSEGKILACDSESILYAVNSKTGKLEWKQKLHDSFKSMFKNGICAQDGIVYAGHGKLYAGQLSYISAVRISDGKVLWKGGDKNRGESSVSTHNINDGRIHATTAFGTRYALDVKTGDLLWSRKHDGGAYNYNYSSATFYKGKMYYTYSRSLVEADPATGEILREIKSSHYFRTASAPIEKDGVLYIGMGDEGVIAYNLENLEEKWVYFTDPSLFYTAPYMSNSSSGVSSNLSVVKGKVFFGASDGKLYCLGVNKGEYYWHQDLGAPILGDVLIDGETLYVGDYAGNLYKYDISSILKMPYLASPKSPMKTF